MGAPLLAAFARSGIPQAPAPRDFTSQRIGKATTSPPEGPEYMTIYRHATFSSPLKQTS